jgi:hypothetical protein
MLQKVLRAYRDGGLRAVSRKAYYLYCYILEAYVRPAAGTKETLIQLNGVDVPVTRTAVDVWLPFYAPAVPIQSDDGYEAAEMDAIRAYVEPGDHVVVVGGGLGVTAVTATRAARESGRVTVFEPSSTAVSVCARTISHHDLDDTVQIEHASIGAPQNSCFTYGPQDDIRRIPYDRMPVDTDVLEMDCEGEELPILQHMTIRPRVVLVETHGNHNAVRDVLIERGYRIDSVIDDRVASAEGDASGDRTHIRAVHPDAA